MNSENGTKKSIIVCKVCVFINKRKIIGGLDSLFTDSNKRKWMSKRINWESYLTELPVVTRKGPNDLGVAQVFFSESSFEEEVSRPEYYITPIEVYIVPTKVLRTLTNLSSKEFDDILTKCQNRGEEKKGYNCVCEQEAIVA